MIKKLAKFAAILGVLVVFWLLLLGRQQQPGVEVTEKTSELQNGERFERERGSSEEYLNDKNTESHSHSQHGIENLEVDADKADRQDESKKISASRIPMNRDQFEKFTQAVLKTLPRKSDLSKLSEEDVHHTPVVIKRAARKIGEVHHELEQSSDLADLGARFYKDCSLGGEYPDTLRAFCAASWLRLARRYAGVEIDGLEQIPSRIQQLALEIENES